MKKTTDIPNEETLKAMREVDEMISKKKKTNISLNTLDAIESDIANSLLEISLDEKPNGTKQ